MTPDDRDRLTRNEADLAHLVKQVDAMAAQLQHVTKVLDRADGGLKTMLWIGSISGMVGAGIVKIVPFLASLPK